MTVADFYAGVGRVIRRSLRKRGIWRTLPFLAFRLSLLAFGIRRPPGISDFDRTYGTDTSGEVLLDRLSIESPNLRFAIPYTASPAALFGEIFRAVELAWEKFVFIDFGSGKGLPMMLASHYPFRRIVGVEFAPELVRIAEENVRRYRGPRRRCTRFEFACIDAVQYEIPAEPAVFYFANPFTRDVMRRVVERIEASLRRNPRPAWILYLNPVEYQIFEQREIFASEVRNADYAIYRFDPQAVAGR